MTDDAAPEVGTLHVCAVPIGNLADASPRLREVLGSVDAIACEDTRTTRRLLDLLGVTPVPRLLAHHDHNERAGAAGIVSLLLGGSNIALVSDAGTPAVNDPGVPLVDAAHAAGIEVVAVAGPSAVAAAVSIAGFAGEGYRFAGFLPRATGDFERTVRASVAELLVAFESPRRIAASLALIADVQPERRVAVCRELTKRHEQVLRGTAAEVAERLAADEVRGEIVVVLAPLVPTGGSEPAASPESVALVALLVEEGVRMKRACTIVADLHGSSSRELYAAMLAARD